jgi:AraC family transcriptional regulator
MITSDLVNKSIDYILQHMDEAISIEDVAKHCHFSKYHFSRVFKAETGENLYGFIKRVRMEQSAIRLKLEKEKFITDIGNDYGYSSSNYSSAFKKHHHLSPAEFRQGTCSTNVPHPFYPDSLIQLQTFEEYDQQIRIEQLEDFLVIYERNLGNYLELGKNWFEFTEKHKADLQENTLLIEKFYDDPSITGVEQCLYDICMTMSQFCTLENRTIIQGGKFAIYRFDGLIKDIFAALQGVFNVWLVNSGHEMDERYGFNIYRKMDRENMRVVMDLCIPIK